jgi:hypothetical protein
MVCVTPPRIAFVTTCKNRTQHLKITLPKNLRDNAGYANCMFVVLDYGSTDDLREWLRAEMRAELASGRLVLYSYRYDGPFRMAHAKNMAHRLGMREGAEILANVDADNFTGFGFAQYVADVMTSHANGYMAVGAIVKGVTPRGLCGRIVVTADQFLQLGGYDERFETWSPDDKDFNQRLRRLGYEPQEIHWAYMDCVRHNDKMRFREYPHVRNTGHCEHAVLTDNDNTVVNFGRIGCGDVWRNGGTEAIQIAALPTRVFGIGMHKTGTTSLHHALRELGLNSTHWPSAHWAKRVWNEMQSGRSLTLERHYAATDFPITTLYRELDRAYPNSKFILSVRPEDEWLESVRRHWLPEHSPYRKQWDGDPFTHKIHREVYGRKTFDADVMLSRYRRHNAEVLGYFAHRKHDLLVHKASDGWAPLCTFLDKPLPYVAYPRANAT